jgi:hypothetical protein
MAIKKNDLIISLLTDLKEDQKVQCKELNEIQIRLAKIELNIEKNTVDLEEHIQGVMQNRARIEALEEPNKFIRTFIKILLGVGTLATAIYGIARMWGF